MTSCCLDSPVEASSSKLSVLIDELLDAQVEFVAIEGSRGGAPRGADRDRGHRPRAPRVVNCMRRV